MTEVEAAPPAARPPWRGRPGIPFKASLGRVFGITRQTWRLSDDPASAAPTETVLVTGRTAAEAADLARGYAQAHPRHGFHKPSASWWGADKVHIHRYRIRLDRRRTAFAVAAAAGALGVAALLSLRRWPGGSPPQAR